MALDMESAEVIEHTIRAAEELNLPRGVKWTAIGIYADALSRYDPKKPFAAGAGSIYIANLHHKAQSGQRIFGKPSQQDIAKAAQVSVRDLRKEYRNILDALEIKSIPLE